MNSFISFLIRDPLRKLIALLLTIVLYAVLNEGKQQQKDISHVPLKIKCDEDVFISGVAADTTLRVVVRGSESRIKNLDMQSIYASIDITRKTPGFDSGNVTFQLEPRDFVTPPGIEVISIEPKTLVIPVEKKISKDIPIVPVVVGHPRTGLAHDGGRCSPYMVTVSGAERALRDLQEIRTEPLAIPRGESMSFSKKVNLISPGDDFVLNITQTEVTVTITNDMSRKLPQKIPVRWQRPLNRDLNIIPEEDTVSVTISGQQDELNKISGDEVLVYADLSDPKYAVPGEYSVKLRAVLDSNAGNVVRISGVEPSEIKIKCERPAAVPDK